MSHQQRIARSGNGNRTREALEGAEKSTIDRDLLVEGAIVCIAVILIAFALSVGRSFFMPVLAATIVGITLSPLQKWGHRIGIPSAAIAVALVAVFFAAMWFVTTLLLNAIAGWIEQAPALEQTLREKFSYFERPISAVRDMMRRLGSTAGDAEQKVSIETGLTDIVRQAIAVLQPALTEFLVFFGTLLFFLVGINRLRRQLIIYFSTREARLRVMHIWNDVEQNLIAYLGTVTVINIALGVAVALMLFLIGFPNPLALGALAFVLNYIPYIGPAIMTIILAIIGIVTYPTLSGAMLAPLLLLAINTIEGHVITPSIVGRRLTLSPLFVFVSLAFWTWLWGPVGAFMATPLLIVGLVILSHLFPPDQAELP